MRHVCPDPLVTTNRIRINTLALGARLPTVHGFREFAEAGGLMSYGPNITDLHRRAAEYVDKILRGAKPVDIPVEQPNQVRSHHQSDHRQNDRPRSPTNTAHPRRRGDRMKAPTSRRTPRPPRWPSWSWRSWRSSKGPSSLSPAFNFEPTTPVRST
jgi:hypothetical protein